MKTHIEMNIIFLSINVPAGEKRDFIAYNFIEKEMGELSRRGHNVYFLTENKKKDLDINGIKYLSVGTRLEKNRLIRRIKNSLFALRHLGQYWHCLIINPRGTVGICGVERALDKIIASKGINVVHTHFFYPEGDNGVVAAKKHNVPVVATLRGAELYNRPELSYGAMRGDFYKIMAKQSTRKVDYFTVPNKFLLDKLVSLFNISSEKVEYLPNGVQLEIVKQLRVKDRNGNMLKLISIGRLIKRKNHILLIEAAELFRDESVDLTIIGEGPELGYLREAIEHRGLKNVRIVDEMSKEELLELMSAYDCLVQPSLIEGMPNVVLESLSLGIPCLVSNIPGHREVIRENYNGFLFDPYQKSDLCSKIRRILEIKHSLEDMRENCRDTARRFTLEKKIDRYLEIYQALTSKGR